MNGSETLAERVERLRNERDRKFYTASGIPAQPVDDIRGAPRKVEYVRCSGCGFRKENSYDTGPRIEPGNYCIECGKGITEYEMLHRSTRNRKQ